MLTFFILFATTPVCVSVCVCTCTRWWTFQQCCWTVISIVNYRATNSNGTICALFDSCFYPRDAT